MIKTTISLLMCLMCLVTSGQQYRLKRASQNLVDPCITMDRWDNLVVAMTSEDDPNCNGSCTANGNSTIVVTKRDQTGSLIWNKEIDFPASDVDRAVHIERDGDNTVVLGTLHRTITGIRNYEINPVVFVLDQNGVMIKGKSIHVPNYHPPGRPVDFVGAHIIPDGTGGYVLTGTVTHESATCFNASTVVRFSVILRLDGNLDVLWGRTLYLPTSPVNHLYASANSALLSLDGNTVFVTGQDRAPDAGKDKPVAYVAAIDLATANLVWHRAYDVIFDDFPFYGVKLLHDNRGKMAWFLRPAMTQNGGRSNIVTIAEVDPGTGSVGNVNKYLFEEIIPSDMEFLNNGTLVISSLSSRDNQALAAVNWPANTAAWTHLFSGPDASPNASLCNAPYFELDNSVSLFYPQNLGLIHNGNIFTVTAGNSYLGKQTVKIDRFTINGKMPTHLGLSQDVLVTPCVSQSYDPSDDDPIITEIEDRASLFNDHSFGVTSWTAGDGVVVEKDDCANGVFVEMLTDVAGFELQDKQVSIFPNPANGNGFFLSIGEFPESINYQIYSITGEMVYHGLILPDTRQEILLDDPAHGLYVLRWNAGGNQSGILELVIE